MKIEFVEEIESTNTELVNRGREHDSLECVLVAFKQSGGKGRRGRNFFSPEKSGLYMSFLVRPKVNIEDAYKLTTLVAVAACEAIEIVAKELKLEDNPLEESNLVYSKVDAIEYPIQIKWVNDLYKNNRKIAGILTECSAEIINNEPKYLVTGIGINLFEPENGFPADIANRAGAIFQNDVTTYSSNELTEIKKRLAYQLVRQFEKYYSVFPEVNFYDSYVKRSFIIGREVEILNGPRVNVIGIDKDFGLIVEHKDGTEEILRAGEVSLVL